MKKLFMNKRSELVNKRIRILALMNWIEITFLFARFIYA